ncbi:hypothetical protein [Alicyclobacillus kakegawensis]|uniref:hypothetical protein n=1 Tax=Alicyclobacillus kakegawensis TaxID=392012 RepID=UPI000836905D|nr:hypothetical protein [Alicyclobacillus kakegawensis]
MSQKETGELKPHLLQALKILFRGLDQGITMTNKDQAQAWIWQSIDDQEVEKIADHLLQLGVASKVAATAIRKMTRTYRALDVGIITVPRAVMTLRFYAEHGGFVLPGLGGMQHAASNK